MPFHAKGRGLLRKMDTTSKAGPLRGRTGGLALAREHSR